MTISLPYFHRSLHFFNSLADQGRNDLAGDNAAADGRLHLAMIFYRRHWPSLTTRQAWKIAYRQYRITR